MGTRERSMMLKHLAIARVSGMLGTDVLIGCAVLTAFLAPRPPPRGRHYGRIVMSAGHAQKASVAMRSWWIRPLLKTAPPVPIREAPAMRTAMTVPGHLALRFELRDPFA